MDALVSWLNLPHFPGLNTFPTIIIQVHVADLPHAPWLSHPDILTTVTEARHHLIHLGDVTHTFSIKNEGSSENINKIPRASLPEPAGGTISSETAGTQRILVMCLSYILPHQLVLMEMGEENASCLIDVVQFGTRSPTVVGFFPQPLGANLDSTSAGLAAA